MFTYFWTFVLQERNKERFYRKHNRLGKEANFQIKERTSQSKVMTNLTMCRRYLIRSRIDVSRLKISPKIVPL